MAPRLHPSRRPKGNHLPRRNHHVVRLRQDERAVKPVTPGEEHHRPYRGALEGLAGHRFGLADPQQQGVVGPAVAVQVRPHHLITPVLRSASLHEDFVRPQDGGGRMKSSDGILEGGWQIGHARMLGGFRMGGHAPREQQAERDASSGQADALEARGVIASSASRSRPTSSRSL